MSREEKRANQEKQLNQICNELQNVVATYKRPQDGETAQKRRDRIHTIGRSIKAAKQKRGPTTKKNNSWRGIVNSTGFPTTFPTTMKMTRQGERGYVRFSLTRRNCMSNAPRLGWNMCITPMVRILRVEGENSENVSATGSALKALASKLWRPN